MSRSCERKVDCEHREPEIGASRLEKDVHGGTSSGQSLDVMKPGRSCGTCGRDGEAGSSNRWLEPDECVRSRDGP